MRQGRTLILASLLLGIAAIPSQPVLSAQDLQLDLYQTELSRALDDYSRKTGVSVVYADRVIAGRTTSCSYGGSNPKEALQCLIGDRVQAVWLRDDQVVLASRPLDPPSYTLRGTVVDSENGNPLPGAHVTVPGVSQGTVADENGRFAFRDVPGQKLRATVSYLGYESRQVDLAAGENHQIVSLSPLMIEGDPVVVEGLRSDESEELQGVARSMTAWMRTSGGRLDQLDLLQSVSTFPGVGRTGEISGGLVIRGGLPDQSVFLLDGAPVYQPWHSQGLFSILQPVATDDVLLFSGPLPADQSGQLAAVLDASLNAGSSVGIRSAASITSSFGEVAVSAPLAPGLTGMFAARRSHQGLSRTHEQSLPNSQPMERGSFYDLAAKVGLQSSPVNRFLFTVYRGGDRLTWSAQNEGQFREPREGSWQNAVYVAQHRYVPNDRVLVTNSIYASTFDATSEQSLGRLTGLPPSDDYQEVRDTGLRINVDYIATPRHTMNVGVQVVQHHLEWSESLVPIATGPPARSTFRDEVLDGALYVQDTWSVNDRLTVRPGLRLSWFGNQVGRNLEPRFHSRYVLSETSHLRFAWSRQVQYLHQVHNIVNGGLGSTIAKWMVSSGPRIAPSTGDQMVLGLTSRRSDYWTVSADVYWRKLNNVFLPGEPSAPAAITHLALYDAPPERFEDFIQGTAKSFGVEFQATYRRDWLRFWTSYTGARSLIQLPSDAPDDEFRPGVYDTPHVVRTSAGFEGLRWAFSLIGEARSGYPTLATVKGGPDDGDLARFPTYFRLDAAVAYRFNGLGGRWDLQGRVYNLTDRDNVVGYEYDENLLNLRRTSLLGVTRWPTFRLQVAW